MEKKQIVVRIIQSTVYNSMDGWIADVVTTNEEVACKTSYTSKIRVKV